MFELTPAQWVIAVFAFSFIVLPIAFYIVIFLQEYIGYWRRDRRVERAIQKRELEEKRK